MGKLRPEEAVREHNRGRKAIDEGRSRYWSEPWAYPFESNEHYELRRQAFEQSYCHQFQQRSKN
jgi:hypothetical protein